MKKILLLISLLTVAVAVNAENYLISTAKTSLLVTATKGERPKYQYYGARIEQSDVQGIFDAGLELLVP